MDSGKHHGTGFTLQLADTLGGDIVAVGGPPGPATTPGPPGRERQPSKGTFSISPNGPARRVISVTSDGGAEKTEISW